MVSSFASIVQRTWNYSTWGNWRKRHNWIALGWTHIWFSYRPMLLLSSDMFSTRFFFVVRERIGKFFLLKMLCFFSFIRKSVTKFFVVNSIVDVWLCIYWPLFRWFPVNHIGPLFLPSSCVHFGNMVSWFRLKVVHICEALKIMWLPLDKRTHGMRIGTGDQ